MIQCAPPQLVLKTDETIVDVSLPQKEEGNIIDITHFDNDHNYNHR